MCTIGNVIKGVVGVASAIIPAVNTYNQQKEIIKYRTNLALNNMEEAKQEGYAQRQLGIEEARKEKLEGLRKSAELMAQNASGGFEATSGNNLYSYEDSIDSSYQNAFDIQQARYIRADNYFDKAREYLNEAKGYQSEKKKLSKNSFFNALGNTGQVASRWFLSK